MDKCYLTIDKWAQDERPREKLLKKGATALSLNELFAILLRSGVGGETSLELARKITADNNNDLNLIAKRGVKELMNKYKGIGMAKATAIVAAMEIGRRRKAESGRKEPRITNSSDAYHYLHSFMTDLEHEEFWVIYLTNGNIVKGCECLSSGGMDGTVIDVRMLFRGALDMKATAILIAHNHPGGNLEPSIHDEMITRKIYEGGKLLDIQLNDHIIVGNYSYFSFSDKGLMNYSAQRLR